MRNVMIKRERKPIAPGTLLLELFLKPRGVTISAFAEAVGFSRKHISNVIHGRARIDAQLAARIGVVLGTSSRVWLNGQAAMDAWKAEKEMKNWKPGTTFLEHAPV
jgi:addiction module HigA family antidote